MTNIAIVDYGMGNLTSVEQALRHVCASTQSVSIAQDSEAIADADKLVFPGQGSAGACMSALKQKGLATALLAAAKEKPFLGICLGLQVLLERSDEAGGTDCLGLYAGCSKHLSVYTERSPDYKIPHMGWNQVRQKNQHPMWHNIEDDTHFYFVHSYCVQPEDQAVVAAETNYAKDFICAISDEKVFAVQFHPEKSSAAGLVMLRNFVQWNGSL